MHEELNERLSDYADGDMDAAQRAAIERHLETCERCRTDLSAIRRVVERAGALPDAGPAIDLWPAIAARIGAVRDTVRAGSRRFTFTLPQLVAAALALMVLSGGMVWLARLGGARADFPHVSAEKAAGSAAAADDRTIAALQRILAARRKELDPARARLLDEQLPAIDRAIEQCSAGLERDPANVYLGTCVTHARARKLELMRDAVAALPAESDQRN